MSIEHHYLPPRSLTVVEGRVALINHNHGRVGGFGTVISQSQLHARVEIILEHVSLSAEA
jgi:hypothetical protein